MLISVIVPVYNVEKYLRVCLESLLKQTYKDLEVIMINDGSTDTSGKICDEYAEKYENFMVIHKKNSGLGMARNTGLKHISGDYVTFLDSDDYLDQECIEILHKMLVKNNVDMCKSGFRRITNSGNIVLNREYEDEVFWGEEARTRLLPRMIGSSPAQHDSIEMCVCGAIYNTKIIKKYNIEFLSERELISEDLVFNIDFMQYANGVCTISDVGYNYRINDNSLTTSYRSNRFEASKHFYLEMKHKLESLKYDNMTFLRLDRMFFIYIKMSIEQECRSDLLLSKKEHIENIKKICSDKIVRTVIRNYPKKKLGIKQNIFLKMIEFRFANLFYFLFSLKKYK